MATMSGAAADVVFPTGEARRRTENDYNRRLIEASLDPLVTIGPDGTITDANTATEQVTGRRRSDLLGTDFSDYFTEPEKARAGYQEAFREGFVRECELQALAVLGPRAFGGISGERVTVMLLIARRGAPGARARFFWLDASGFTYTWRDIKIANPTQAELREWYKKAVCRCGVSLIPAASSIKPFH